MTVSTIAAALSKHDADGDEGRLEILEMCSILTHETLNDRIEPQNLET